MSLYPWFLCLLNFLFWKYLTLWLCNDLFLSASYQTEVSESVSQRSSSVTLWKSRATSNHPDLISLRLPSPSLSLPDLQATHTVCTGNWTGNREIKAFPFSPDMCQWQREGVIFIIWAFFINVQAGGEGELLPFGSCNQIDDGRRIRFKNHAADRDIQTHWCSHECMHSQGLLLIVAPDFDEAVYLSMFLCFAEQSHPEAGVTHVLTKILFTEL